MKKLKWLLAISTAFSFMPLLGGQDLTAGSLRGAITSVPELIEEDSFAYGSSINKTVNQDGVKISDSKTQAIGGWFSPWKVPVQSPVIGLVNWGLSKPYQIAYS